MNKASHLRHRRQNKTKYENLECDTKFIHSHKSNKKKYWNDIFADEKKSHKNSIQFSLKRNLEKCLTCMNSLMSFQMRAFCVNLRTACKKYKWQWKHENRCLDEIFDWIYVEESNKLSLILQNCEDWMSEKENMKMCNKPWTWAVWGDLFSYLKALHVLHLTADIMK